MMTGNAENYRERSGHSLIEGQKRAWQRLLDKFRANGNHLTTADFAHDPTFACEYRRLMCDLAKKGFVISRIKIQPNLWSYRLIEQEDSGQMHFA